MNYTELVTAIQDFTEYAEADFVANIPIFVRAAEQRIQDNCEIPMYRRTQRAVLTPSNKYLDVPDDFINPFFMAVEEADGDLVPLIEKQHDWITEAYGDGTTGQPKYYSIIDQNSFIFGPTPNNNYAVQVTYNAKHESIVDVSENWISLNASNALLFGALAYAAVFMEAEDATISTYERLFNEAMKGLMDIGDWRAKRDEFRMPNIRSKEPRT